MLSKKIIFLSSFLLCNQLSAIDLGESTTLHGFGTLGGSYNTNGDFLYRENVFSNIGSSNDFSLATHTKLGLQLDTNLTDNLKATIQTVLYQKEKGQIEISTTPCYHPILPLLIDINTGKEADPNINVPEATADFKDFADIQVANAIDIFENEFGFKPNGFWPGEGSVSNDALKLIGKYGIKWVGTDQDILFKSTHNYDKHNLYKKH